MRDYVESKGCGERFYGRSGGAELSVIVGKYIESDGDNDLDDYKMFVMNDKTMLILVCTGCIADAYYEDYYDMVWNPIEGRDMGGERSGKTIPKPGCFDEMVDAVEKPTVPFNHACVRRVAGEQVGVAKTEYVDVGKAA